MNETTHIIHIYIYISNIANCTHSLMHFVFFVCVLAFARLWHWMVHNMHMNQVDIPMRSLPYGLFCAVLWHYVYFNCIHKSSQRKTSTEPTKIGVRLCVCVSVQYCGRDNVCILCILWIIAYAPLSTVYFIYSNMPFHYLSPLFAATADAATFFFLHSNQKYLSSVHIKYVHCRRAQQL